VKAFVVLLHYETQGVFRRPSWLLLFALFAIFWLWIFALIIEGSESQHFIDNDVVNLVLSMFDDEFVAPFFLERPQVLSVIFLLAMHLLPLMTMVAASDQTASDVNSGFVRLLVCRCGRLEVYLAKLFSVILTLAFMWFSIISITVVISLFIDGKSLLETIGYALKIFASLFLYAMPIAAMMAFWSSLLASTLLSMLFGITVYSLITAVILMTDSGPGKFLLPSSFRDELLSFEPGPFLLGILAMILYTTVFAGAGYAIFRKRSL